jgi:hypothetical protein
MGKKIVDRFFILIILFILFMILLVAVTIKTELPKVYLDETISIVGKFIESFISFFKK